MNQITNVFRDQMTDLVKRSGLFKNLTSAELNRFIDLKTVLFTCEDDEYLIRDGDTECSLYILLSGTAGVYKNGVLVSEISAGECIGEISFLTGRTRTADVRAHSRIIAIRLNSASYERLPCEIREKIRDSLILKLVHRIDQMNQQHALHQPRSYFEGIDSSEIVQLQP